MALTEETLLSNIAERNRDAAISRALDNLAGVAFGRRVRHQVRHCSRFGKLDVFACTDRTNINIGYKELDLLRIRALSFHELGHCLFTRSYKLSEPTGIDRQSRRYFQNALEDGRIENLISRLGGPVVKNSLMWLAVSMLKEQFDEDQTGANKSVFLGWYAAIYGRVNVPNWLKAKLRKFYISKGIPAELLTKIEKIVKRYLYAKTQSERDLATFSFVRLVKAAYPQSQSDPKPEKPEVNKPKPKKNEEPVEDQPEVDSSDANENDEGVEADTEEDLEGQIGKVSSEEKPKEKKDEKKDGKKGEGKGQDKDEEAGDEDAKGGADADEDADEETEGEGKAEGKDESKSGDEEDESEAEGAGAGADSEDEGDEDESDADAEGEGEGKGEGEAKGDAEGEGEGEAKGDSKGEGKNTDGGDGSKSESSGAPQNDAGSTSMGHGGDSQPPAEEADPSTDLNKALKEVAEAVSEAIEGDVNRLREVVRAAGTSLSDNECRCDDNPITVSMTANENNLYRRLRDIQIEANKSVRGYAGRLNTGSAISKLARGNGRLCDAKIFTRTAVDDHGGKLRVYIAEDKSGSMSQAVINGLSQFAWEVQSAVRRSGGECVVRAFDTEDYEITNERGTFSTPRPYGDTELAPSAESIINFFRAGKEKEGKLLIILTDCGVSDLAEVGVMLTQLKRMGVVVWVGAVPFDSGSGYQWVENMKTTLADFANTDVVRAVIEYREGLIAAAAAGQPRYGSDIRRGDVPEITEGVHKSLMDALNLFLKDFAAKVAAATR